MAELVPQLLALIDEIGDDYKDIWAKLGAGGYDTAAQNVRDAINELKGLVDAANLGQMDDVQEVANQAALPDPGETGVLYVALDNNRLYRWSGTAYVHIPTSPGSTTDVPEGTNLYYTEARVNAVIDERVGDTTTDFVAAYNAAKA